MSTPPDFNGAIVVCGCVRNSARRLRTNLRRLSALARSVSKLHVVIAENDSRDRTREVAESWMDGAPEHHIVDPDLTGVDQVPAGKNPLFGPRRIQKMVALRNVCLDRVESSGMQVDRVVWIDLDIAKFKVSDLLRSLEVSRNHDGVFANGLMPTKDNRGYAYYDTYATLLPDEGRPQSLARMERIGARLSELTRESPLVPVLSAFGGIGIYDAEAVRGLRYRADPNDDEDITSLVEHTAYQADMAERGHGSLVIDPALRVLHETRLNLARRKPELWLRKHVYRRQK